MRASTISLLLAFALCCVFSTVQSSKAETPVLRLKRNLNRLSEVMKTFPYAEPSLHLRVKRGYSSGGGGASGSFQIKEEEAPLFAGLTAFVDAIGQIIRSLLQILGLIPQDSEGSQMHYCYGGGRF